jgi:hypothetical protein
MASVDPISPRDHDQTPPLAPRQVKISCSTPPPRARGQRAPGSSPRTARPRARRDWAPCPCLQPPRRRPPTRSCRCGPSPPAARAGRSRRGPWTECACSWSRHRSTSALGARRRIHGRTSDRIPVWCQIQVFRSRLVSCISQSTSTQVESADNHGRTYSPTTGCHREP